MNRRLTTILAADMVGYTRMMSQNENRVITRLRAARREVIDPSIGRWGGVIIKTMGDGMLVELPSPASAVTSALEVQQIMRGRESGPEEHRIRFRVGINIGPVVIDAGEMLGDVVNVASRLEGLAPPGGVCVSRPVRDSLRGRCDTRCIPLGHRRVKNLPDPLEAWLVEPTVELSAATGGLRR